MRSKVDDERRARPTSDASRSAAAKALAGGVERRVSAAAVGRPALPPPAAAVSHATRSAMRPGRARSASVSSSSSAVSVDDPSSTPSSAATTITWIIVWMAAERRPGRATRSRRAALFLFASACSDASSSHGSSEPADLAGPMRRPSAASMAARTPRPPGTVSDSCRPTSRSAATTDDGRNIRGAKKDTMSVRAMGSGMAPVASCRASNRCTTSSEPALTKARSAGFVAWAREERRQCRAGTRAGEVRCGRTMRKTSSRDSVSMRDSVWWCMTRACARGDAVAAARGPGTKAATTARVGTLVDEDSGAPPLPSSSPPPVPPVEVDPLASSPSPSPPLVPSSPLMPRSSTPPLVLSKDGIDRGPARARADRHWRDQTPTPTAAQPNCPTNGATPRRASCGDEGPPTGRADPPSSRRSDTSTPRARAPLREVDVPRFLRTAGTD
mmetsp:Transcript_5936/g.19375  ORF Transcript_5936/g.19375 Transcript_5936/m.19375 type:complete len:442 (+) Transcript_5936:1030-2355(+)